MARAPSEKEMDDFIMKSEGLEAIEDSLEEFSQKLFIARAIRDNAKRGEIPFLSRAKNKTEIEEIILDSQKETDAFLKVNVPDKPAIQVLTFLDRILYIPRMMSASIASIFSPEKNREEIVFQYDSFYYRRNKRVVLASGSRAETFSHYAHEYTHYIQHVFSMINEFTLLNNYKFLEGHARCVEINVAVEKAEKIDNPTFAIQSIERFVGEMKSAYKYYSKKMGKNPRQTLLRMQCENDKYEAQIMDDTGGPSVYAFGNAFFMTREKERGKSVYADALLGRLS